MRSIGASRSQNASRATVAAISAPMPNGTTASCAINSRLVLWTESRVAAASRRGPRAQVDPLDRDPFAGHALGGGDGLVDHPGDRYDGDVGSGAHDGGRADR